MKKIFWALLVGAFTISSSAQIIPQRRYLEPQITVQSVAPTNVFIGLKWVDTSVSPPVLYYWDGATWVEIGVAGVIPGSFAGEALSLLRVNAGETALEFIPGLFVEDDPGPFLRGDPGDPGTDLGIEGGNGTGTGNGGALSLNAGAANTGNAGAAMLSAGDSTGVGGATGALTLSGGDARVGATDVNGGDAILQGGDQDATTGTGEGGSLTLRGGDTTAGDSTGDGGNVTVRGGNAGGAGSGTGGNVVLTPGTGTTSDGQVQVTDPLYLTGGIEINDATSATRILEGSGTPEGSVTASEGSLYLDTTSTDGKLYVKTTGAGNTGWAELASSATIVTAFTGLSDTAGSYAGAANSLVRVNAGETALEFPGSLTLTDSGTDPILSAVGDNMFLRGSGSSPQIEIDFQSSLTLEGGSTSGGDSFIITTSPGSGNPADALRLQTAATSGQDGAPIFIEASDGGTASAGGDITIQAGDGSTTGAGGNIIIAAGDDGASAVADSGNLTLTTEDGQNDFGGAMFIDPGLSEAGSGDVKKFHLFAQRSEVTTDTHLLFSSEADNNVTIGLNDDNTVTEFIIHGDNAVTVATAGGDLSVSAGDGSTTGAGGDLNLNGGDSGTGTPGDVVISGGSSSTEGDVVISGDRLDITSITPEYGLVRVSSFPHAVVASDYHIVADGNGDVDLPPCDAANDGRLLRIKKISTTGSGNVTIDADGADLIDGSGTQTLSSQYSSIDIVCESANTAWWIY